MTPLDRLLAESLPTGTFGHALPPPEPAPRPISRWTPAEQARHYADLKAALDGWAWHDGRAAGRRHLRAVDEAA